MYRSVIIGLTGIGAMRPEQPGQNAVYGRLPQSHASAYHAHPQTELVAVCDIRQQMLDQFRERWQEVWPDLRYYTNYQAMLAQEKPEFVSVVTPDHLHANITVDAANSGAKAIFCEKPIATTLADADRMIATCEANNVVLSIDHTRRWWPLFQQARTLIRSGELGVLRSIVVSLFSPRAMLFRNGTHFVDMIHFLADAEAEWVWAELEPGFDHFDRYRGDGGHNPASEPYASGYIHFANGVRAFFESVKIPYPGAQFVLTCEQGRIEMTDEQMTITRQDATGKWTATPIVVEETSMTGLLWAIDELVQHVAHGGELISSGRSARKTLEVLLAMLQSHKRGNVRVQLPLAETGVE